MYHVPMKKATYILDSLRARGYRLTESRKKVVELLEKMPGPVAATDIVQRYKDDPVVVYRTLEILKKEDLVTVVTVRGGVDRYELVGHHHHHIVCDQCHKIAAVPCLKVSAPQKLPADFRSLDSHEVTFYGRCRSCAQ